MSNSNPHSYYCSADVKAEVIALEVIENGENQENIFFLSSGTFKRAHQKDVANVLVEDAGRKGKKITFSVNRDGLYDALPEGVFHKKNNIKPHKTAKEVAEEIKQHRQEELAARKFFAPFENELYHIRLLLEQKEKASVNVNTASVNQATHPFKKFWQIPDNIDAGYLTALFNLLPNVWKVKGRKEIVQQQLSQLLGLPVTISEINLQRENNQQHIPCLGEATLGEDAVLSAVSYKTKAWNICISEVELKNMTDYLPGGKAVHLIDFMMKVLMPAYMAYQVETLFSASEEMFQLSTDEEDCYLGYSTVFS